MSELEDERVSAPVDHQANVDDVLAVEREDEDEFDAPASGELPISGPADVVQDEPASDPIELRVDFGAHFEANYPRLVAQLYAITLDAREAHDVVQDAYSRAWRQWAEIGATADPSAWVRRVAVRSTVRSWRRLVARFRARPEVEGVDARTGALLAALGRLGAAERRAVVLHHMAGVPVGEIAAVEQASRGTVQARLTRARHVVVEGMADVLPEVLGVPARDFGESDEFGDEGVGS